jgi:hypothetical protein
MIFLHLVCNFGSSEQTTRGATAAAANTPASQAQISLLSCPLLTLVARSSPGACFQQKPRPSSSNLRCRLSIVKRAKLFKQKSFSLTLANRIISFFFCSQEWSLLLLPRICFLCTYQRWHTMGWGFKISKLLKSIFFFMWGRDFFFFSRASQVCTNQPHHANETRYADKNIQLPAGRMESINHASFTPWGALE